MNWIHTGTFITLRLSKGRKAEWTKSTNFVTKTCHFVPLVIKKGMKLSVGPKSFENGETEDGRPKTEYRIPNTGVNIPRFCPAALLPVADKNEWSPVEGMRVFMIFD